VIPCGGRRFVFFERLGKCGDPFELMYRSTVALSVLLVYCALPSIVLAIRANKSMPPGQAFTGLALFLPLAAVIVQPQGHDRTGCKK
jgi:hypothetical protein